MNTSDSGTRSEKLKCSNQQKVCTEEEEEEHLGMSVSRCGGHVGASAFTPHRKKRKKSLWGGFTASIVCVTKHKPTFKNVTFYFMNGFRDSSTGKFIKKNLKQETLWHDDDVMERLGSDSRNRDSALNLIMESTISRPNLQNIHLIVRFNRGKQETRPRKNDWVTRPDHSVWGRIAKSALNFNMKDTNFWT